MTPDVTLPGQSLGYSEEYAGGPGTFEDNGMLYASNAGTLARDEAQHTVRIEGRVQVHPLQVGDTILARVHDIFDQIASFLIVRVENKPGERAAVGRDMVFIRISEVQRAYTENFRDVLRIGDVVRARILEVTGLGTYITMKDSGLGVVQAYCSHCRSSMDGRGPILNCTYCRRREPRKTIDAQQQADFRERRPFRREPFRGDRPQSRSFDRPGGRSAQLPSQNRFQTQGDQQR